MKSKQRGISLIETLLALAIALSLILLGVRQYQYYRRDADLQALKYNVDLLFTAMERYYNAACLGLIYSSDGSTLQYEYVGSVQPYYFNGTVSPVLSTSLKNYGFLTDPIPYNPLVVNNGGMPGYVTQFNRNPQTSRTMINSNGSSVVIGDAASFTIQVSVQIANQHDAQTYLEYLGANCLSTAETPQGDAVTPCSLAPAAATQYLVWERMPANASPNTASDLTPYYAPTVLFNQMYTTYPTQYLMDNTGSTALGTQYFLCGG